ncbi:chromosome transmission fidelity protein 8 homolog [Cryptotermes secundus]|uniref:chromosome transmission fidelity protein 8 homolog n=1 Tax=Cryptotermes secundus TaxID=105785 RepID=UPI000CD7D7B4|nr:chromosome transmission fidelity protein 8 homolog [Cryptotermes secundus]
MSIIVKIPNDSSVGEWAIVELQGDLKSRNGSSMHQQFIGDLHYTNKGNPMLIIGHHILHGEVVTMDKPFAILEQKQTGETAELQDTVEYHIKAIVHPIVPAPGDIWGISGITGGKREKPTMFITNTTWAAVGLNLALRCKQPTC